MAISADDRFLTVSDRFTRELGKYASAAQPTKDAEIRIEHLLRGMRHLKLRMYPEDELEMSAEFLQQLASFFSSAHGQNLKCAYADTLTSLLHPVIETATAEVNHPMWAKAVAVILSRALTMAQKPRYWTTAFPLVVVSLGVSPKEVFLQHWSMCMDAITARLKVSFAVFQASRLTEGSRCTQHRDEQLHARTLDLPKSLLRVVDLDPKAPGPRFADDV